MLHAIKQLLALVSLLLLTAIITVGIYYMALGYRDTHPVHVYPAEETAPAGESIDMGGVYSGYYPAHPYPTNLYYYPGNKPY
jgi:hypothetical protein